MDNPKTQWTIQRHNGQSRDTMDNPETQHTKHNTERAFRNGQSRDTMDNPETQHTKHNTERAFRNGQSRDTTRTLLNEKQNKQNSTLKRKIHCHWIHVYE
jgi:hypothetical protein